MRKIALLLVLAASPALSAIRSDQALSPAIISAAAPNQGQARVASDGTNFFAVWRTYITPTTVVIGGGRVSPAGELLDRPSIFFAASDSTLGAPEWLATNGKTVLLATARNRFRLLAPDGTSLGAERDIPNAGSGAFSIASNADRYLIAYASAQDVPRSVFIVLTCNGAFLASQTLPPGQPAIRFITTASHAVR